ncbi:hypothetical protein HYV43_06510 [Candidatus Micrarchaeota archaeon]|nr:hypothetical protein [Candidatus Micrarchaeota archaeon]
MNRFFLLFFLAIALAACLQPSATVPSASPTSSFAATVTPTTVMVTATPSPSLAATALPSPTATALPSTAASANASSFPTLADAALRLEPVLNDIFNVSRVTKRKDTTFSLIDASVWSMGAVEGDYVYSVTLSNARVHWRPEELLESAVNASGTRNGFLSYSVGASDKANVMKCYGQRYELNLNLKSYSRTWFGQDYQPLMRRIMGRLVDACPP